MLHHCTQPKLAEKIFENIFLGKQIKYITPHCKMVTCKVAVESVQHFVDNPHILEVYNNPFDLYLRRPVDRDKSMKQHMLPLSMVKPDLDEKDLDSCELQLMEVSKKYFNGSLYYVLNKYSINIF